jgi:hypothetical protein
MDRTRGSAWDHGHPNLGVVEELLSVQTTGARIPNITGNVFDGQESEPIRLAIEKNVFCTCWDHTILVEADSQTGDYTVLTNQ